MSTGIASVAQDSANLKPAFIMDPVDSIIRSRESSLLPNAAPTVCGQVTSSDWDTQTPYIRFRAAESSFENSTLWMENHEVFETPVKGVFVRGFGGAHKGMDVALRMGDSVRTSWSGVVRYAGYDNGGYGNLIVVRHCNGLETWYGHLSAIRVRPDQPVSKGSVIGLGGSTGRSTGPHLHFETRYLGKPIDPNKVIRSNNGTYVFGTLESLKQSNSESRIP